MNCLFIGGHTINHTCVFGYVLVTVTVQPRNKFGDLGNKSINTKQKKNTLKMLAK